MKDFNLEKRRLVLSGVAIFYHCGLLGTVVLSPNNE